ncbi:MAG: efflux RND transporter permease subunit, partial [Spirochaetes bacterium]|nr:efflux RND transporter permease subunit [Spirochaetota bacterium]
MVTIKPTTDSFYPTSSNHFEPPHTRTLRFTFLFLILFTSVVLLGVQIPLSYCSRGASLSLQVLIEYRGAFEREIERDITIPLENALSEIQGLKEIVSISEPGQSRIHLYLSDGSSLEDAYLETRDAVDRLYMLFPSSVQRPLILRSDPKNEPVFIAAFPLNGDLSEDDLKRRFQTVDGVGEVEVGGGTKEETVIRWFVEKGLSTKLTLSETVEVLRGWNVSGGVVLTPGTSLKLQSLLPNSESIGQVSLRTILRVKDVAEVVNRPVYRERRARVNGKELLVLYLKPTGEANLLRLSEQLTRICRSIPGSSVLYDQGGMIRSALNELFWALGIGVTSVGILTGIFLKSLLPSLLVSLSIPFSTFAALAVLHLLGKTLDVVSLSALTVGSGLVIDSGVILTERLFQERNGSLKEVLSEVKDPILLSTITTVGVFVPLIFAPPSIRLQFEPLAFTLSAQLGASLIYSLVFLPLFLARHRSRRTSIHLPNFFSGLKSRLECFYRIVHSHPLQVRISIIAGFVFLFGGGITFLLLLPKGEARLHDRTQLDFLIEFESGIPLEQVMAQSDALERFLSQHACVAQVRVKYERERANFAIQLSTDKQGPEKNKNQKTLSTLSIPQKRLRLLQEIRHWASRIPHG